MTGDALKLADFAAAARIFAAGIFPAKDGPIARFTLTLHPTSETTIEALLRWPKIMRAVFGEGDGRDYHGSQLAVKVKPYCSEAAEQHPGIATTLEWQPPDVHTADHIESLWRRMMSPPGSEPDDLAPWRALHDALGDPAKRVSYDLVVPTPHSEVALALTLERGRHVLDEVAGGSLRGRPDLDRNAAWPSKDHEGRSIARDDQDWSDHYRRVTAATRSGLDVAPWPHPKAFVEASLSRTQTFGHLVAQAHAAHRLATCLAAPKDGKCRNEEAKAIAKRRLGALLALPVLQRIVGFAADLTCPLALLKGQQRFLALGCSVDDKRWTLARFEPDGEPKLFIPATAEEAAEEKERVDRLGLFDLGRSGDHGPHYDICTVDPPLAAEGDLQRTVAEGKAKDPDRRNASSAPSTAGLQTLRSGGLRLIDRNRLLATCKHPPATAAPETEIEDAKALQTGMRLLIAIRASGKVVWRCPQYRLITYADPDPPDGLSDWLECEIVRRLRGPDESRRLELDAASLGTFDRFIEKPVDNKFAVPAPDLDKKIVQLISESCVAAWGGSPMGSETDDLCAAGRKDPNGAFTRTTTVIQELNITRRFAAPSAATGQAAETLGPLLRFGWPYHLALLRIFVGGGSLTMQQAGALLGSDAGSGMALPAVSPGIVGRRYLRHERLDAPMLVFPESHLARLASEKPLQDGAKMIVRSSLKQESARLPSTRRILFAPPVPRHFAELHDVFAKAAPSLRAPPHGLQAVSFPVTRHKSAPKRARIGKLRHGEAAGVEYYPDPAASFMMLVLRAPGPHGEGYLGKPLALSVCTDRTWPNTIPVHIELIASPTSKGAPHLADLGRRWLGKGEQLLNGPAAGAIEVRSVAVHLGPGEDVELDAWMAPAPEQLARWFDAVEAAALLATHEGSPQHALDAGDACARGLASLVGGDAAKLGTDPAVCTAAAGIAVPPPKRIRLLAESVHETMLRGPLAALAGVLKVEMTHAVSQDLVPAPRFGKNGVTIARRLFAGGNVRSTPASASAETRAEFINRLRAADWDERCSEENAKGALFGGDVEVDLAATGAMELEIECASPSTDKMDDPDRGRSLPQKRSGGWPEKLDVTSDQLFGFHVDSQHRVSFAKRRVKGLRIDSLPKPANAAAGMRKMTLEDLQMASWQAKGGPAAAPETALRVSQTDTLTALGARLLHVRPLAINRHAGLMPAGDAQETTPGAFVDVWMPSTIRPSPPVIDRIDIGLHERQLPTVKSTSSTTSGRERSTTLRIWLQRPWLSSGEDEKLGLVLWPPGLFSNGTSADADGSPLEGALMDEDLGPGGRFVTRWGVDATTAGSTIVGPLVDPAAIEGDGDKVPSAFMPVPLRDPHPSIDDSELPPQGSDASFVPTRFLRVALRTFTPRFDPIEELWYVDFRLRTDPVAMPRVRLGLVRYQTHAREDDRAEEGSEPVRLRVSAPAVAWIRPLPGRRAEATVHRRKGGVDVYVTLRGPSGQPAQAYGDQGPAVEIELRRFQSASEHGPSVEEVCTGTDGPCVWKSWMQAETSPPIPVEGGWLWTCVFAIPKGLDPLWRYAAVIMETDRRLPANPDFAPPAIGSSGLRSLTRLEIE